MLGRHQPPSEGDILLDNGELEQQGVSSSKSCLHLPQQMFHEGMTVRESGGDWPLSVARRAGTLWRRGPGKVDEAITLVGLKPLARFARRQSFPAASASARGLPCWSRRTKPLSAADEPTSALDIAHQVDVLALVHQA